jgi:hypothetical protein
MRKMINGTTKMHDCSNRVGLDERNFGEKLARLVN